MTNNPTGLETLQTLLQRAHPSYKPSWAELLASLGEIELSEEETAEALVLAKQRKLARIKSQQRDQREAENRRLLTQQDWSFEQIDSFVHQRAAQLYGDRLLDQPFRFDDQVKPYYHWLCYYFAKDPRFMELSSRLGVENPSFDKGILLGGNVGVGKTTLMRLFQRNRRQVYTIQNAKAIADLFEAKGEESMGQFIESPKLPVNDVENFYHTNMGLCIDDLGTETLKNHYGNKKNVIGDVIELRYDKGNAGTLLHLTTNLTGDQVLGFYGQRVSSRIRQCLNVVDFLGQDRRK